MRSGSLHDVLLNGVGRDKRLERYTANTRGPHAEAVGRRWSRELFESSQGARGRRAQGPAQADQRLETLGNTEPAFDRLIATERPNEQRFSSLHLLRRGLREPADRLTQRTSDAALSLDREPGSCCGCGGLQIDRAGRRLDAALFVDMGRISSCPYWGCRGAGPSLGRLADSVRRFCANLGER